MSFVNALVHAQKPAHLQRPKGDSQLPCTWKHSSACQPYSAMPSLIAGCRP